MNMMNEGLLKITFMSKPQTLALCFQRKLKQLPTQSSWPAIMQPTGVTGDAAQPTGIIVDAAQPTGITVDAAQPTGTTVDMAQSSGIAVDAE